MLAPALSLAAHQVPAAAAAVTPRSVPAGFGFGLASEPTDLTWMTGSGVPWTYRYTYLAGGVNTGNGWETWNTPAGQYATYYMTNTASRGYIPVFPYYELLQSLPSSGTNESDRDWNNLNNASTMNAYYANFALLMQKAGAFGGQVIVHPMAVGDQGTMFVVTDPGGAAIGGWQPDTHPGFREFGQANTPSWFELWTRDYDASVAFYRNVFRWDTETMGDSPEFRYTTLKGPDGFLAGIMDASAFLPEGVPSHWSVYFGCDDADATLKRIGDLGGATVVDAEDTPYGRLATATDPMGAQFKLVAPNEAMPARS